MAKNRVLINHVRERRRNIYLSQAALANLVGVSTNTICSIENGHFNPTARLALRLCEELHCKFEDLFELVYPYQPNLEV